jgi:hypothetical protein
VVYALFLFGSVPLVSPSEGGLMGNPAADNIAILAVLLRTLSCGEVLARL